MTERYADKSSEDHLILVDENDQEIGSALKKDCHIGNGILHRAFSVFIFNEENEVLLQQRSEEKMLWGKFWSNACCSHPKLGETIEDAAQRRIKEELSIEAKLNFLFKFEYQEKFEDIGSENELCHVLIGKCDEEPNFDPNEISDLKYLSIEEMTRSIEESPNQYTPWLKIEWSKIIGPHFNEVKRFLDLK